MPRFRLRYRTTDIEMPVGDFIIGRSSSSNLPLDDALVSRHHAVLHVSESAVVVEDLGSRNGVLVNGKRIRGKEQVGNRDRIAIGAHELLITEIADAGEGIPCESCGAKLSPGQKFCPDCGARAGSPPVGAGSPAVPTGGASADEVTRAASAFDLITGIADKALTLGRFEEAERMLSGHLDAMLRRAETVGKVLDVHVHIGTRFALRLAEGTSQAKWVDWVFKMHAASRRMMQAETIDKLHELVRKIRYDDPRPLRDYLNMLRGRLTSLTPAERFLLQRLEGLERVVAA